MAWYVMIDENAASSGAQPSYPSRVYPDIILWLLHKRPDVIRFLG
jgi:hypothetical protein